uniref:Uncharacterized protein n=1 Tax=Romanomermis culicivorax TaxID=13658 RepID=A0A915HX43_ROMCU
MDKFVFIKDIGNKSWAEIVEEDEEYIRETEKIRQAAKRPRTESSNRSPLRKSPRKLDTDDKVNNQCKKKIRFEKDENLTKLVCGSLKCDRSRLRQQYMPWSERLRSSPKKDTPAKTSNNNRNSTSCTNWRKKPLLDEDSQNTLTEVAQITKQVVLKPREDDNTQSCFGAERPKRTANAPKRYPLPESGNFEEDQSVISRREKDLSKGYNSEVYKRYREVIAKY